MASSSLRFKASPSAGMSAVGPVHPRRLVSICRRPVVARVAEMTNGNGLHNAERAIDVSTMLKDWNPLTGTHLVAWGSDSDDVRPERIRVCAPDGGL